DANKHEFGSENNGISKCSKKLFCGYPYLCASTVYLGLSRVEACRAVSYRRNVLMTKIRFVLLMAVVLVFALAASAQEKKIKKSDLPAAVQKTADEQSKGATVKGYNSEVEDGKTIYEVELTVNGHSRDVSISPAGEVVELEEEVTLDS